MRAPFLFRMRITREKRNGNPCADHASAVYCTRTHIPRQLFERRRRERKARRQPRSAQRTRSIAKPIPCLRSASPRCRQYSSTPSVGVSARPRSAIAPCRIMRAVSFFDEEVTYDQRVHAGAEERANRIGRSVHDGFSAQIKGSVHDEGHASAFAKFIDQPPI